MKEQALRTEMIERFDQVDKRFDQVDKRFEQVDKRFEQLEKRLEDGFAAVAEQFGEQRAYAEFGYQRLETATNSGLARLERKLDQIAVVSPKTRSRKRP